MKVLIELLVVAVIAFFIGLFAAAPLVMLSLDGTVAYYNKGFVCYSAAGIILENDRALESHEECHYWVSQDYYHFCEEYY